MTETTTGSATVSVLFTDEDLGLIRRVLTFADAQVPIEDQLGGKIYPTEETRRHAVELESKLEAAGITVSSGLYTAFDPFEVRDRVATARYVDPDGYEHNVKGLVTGVEQLEDGTWELRLGKTKFYYTDPANFKANIYVELNT